MDSTEENEAVKGEQMLDDEHLDDDDKLKDGDEEEVLSGDGVIEEDEDINKEMKVKKVEDATDADNVKTADVEDELADDDDDDDGDEDDEDGDEDDDDDDGDEEDEEEEDCTSKNLDNLVILDEASNHSEEQESDSGQDADVMGEDDQPVEENIEKANALIAYPVLEEDLDGPVIKPVLNLSRYFYVKFLNLRHMPKEGVLDLRFKTDALRKKAYEKLCDVKLCGECQPRIEVSVLSYEHHHTLLSKAAEFVTKRNPEEEPAEPVCVFVNNIPLDGRVEMLHFLYPSARGVQLPVNSQGSAMGYAIVEFANLEEAEAVVKNNKEYAARIGDSYLNLHVIGHEEVKVEPQKLDRSEKSHKTSPTDPSQKQKSEKKPEAISKSTKCPSDKKGPVDKDSKQPHKDDQEKQSSEKAHKRKSPSSSPPPTKARRVSSSDDRSSTRKNSKRFTVFVGNCKDATASELIDFMNNKMEAAGICKSDERPVKNAVVINRRKFQFVEFDSAKYALAAIKKLDGLTFKGQKLNLQEGRNMLPLIKEIELEKGHSRRDDRRPVSRRAPSTLFYNVFVGNCPETDPDEFRDFLNKQMASEGLCRVDEYPVKKTQVQDGRAYQFAVFCSASYAIAAIENLNSVMFKDSKLNIREGQNDRPLTECLELEKARHIAGKADEESTIYVGNCPLASVAEYHDFFTKSLREKGICGLNEHVIKRVKKKTGRDFQFIVFYEQVHAIAAVEELDGLSFKGSKLKIKPANRISANPMMDAPLEGLVSDYPWAPDLPLNNAGIIQDMPQGDSEGFDVFVGNVPPTSCDDLEYFFRREIILRGLCNIDENPILKIKFSNNRQYQFVVFKTAAAAMTAISELDGVVFKGSKLKIQAGQNAMAVNMMQQQPMDLPIPMDMQSVLNMQRSLGMQRSLNMAGSVDLPGSLNMQRAMDMSGSLNMSRSMDMHRSLEMQLPQLNFVQNLLNQASSYAPEEIEDETTEGFEVYMGNLPKAAKHSEKNDIMNFIQQEFVKRGLCRIHEQPVLRMKFELGRIFQFAVFRHQMDARSAIEELNGKMYKGYKLKVKEGITVSKNPSSKPSTEARGRQTSRVQSARPRQRESRGSSFTMPQDDDSGGTDVHVGNVPKCTPFDLKNFFLRHLQDIGLCEEGDDPIRNIRYFPKKSFQFVTFHDESDAIAAVNVLDGVVFRGAKLKVGMGHKKQ